ALLAVKVARLVASPGGVIALVPRPKALLRGPSLNQGAIDAEVLIAHQITPARLLDHLGEQGRNHLVLKKSVLVLAEGRMVPHRIVNAQANKPAKQQVVLNVLHQLAVAANAVEHTKQ